MRGCTGPPKGLSRLYSCLKVPLARRTRSFPSALTPDHIKSNSHTKISISPNNDRSSAATAAGCTWSCAIPRRSEDALVSDRPNRH